jgi:hypothetical protein
MALTTAGHRKPLRTERMPLIQAFRFPALCLAPQLRRAPARGGRAAAGGGMGSGTGEEGGGCAWRRFNARAVVSSEEGQR